MAPCKGSTCYYGFETIITEEMQSIHGAYKNFIEIMSFTIFIVGVTLNTIIITISITNFSNLGSFDGFLMNLSFAEIISSFGIAFVFFVEFTTSMAPLGDHGCQFVQWLNVTSVSITGAALVIATYDLYRKLYYGNTSQSLPRTTFWLLLISSWVFASLPGIPYLFTGRMGSNNFCVTTHWSQDAEILYISVLFVLQILIPMVAQVFFFVRIFIAIRAPREGDINLVDETNPGSEAGFQRANFKRKVMTVFLISIAYFSIMLVFIIISLSLALNIDNIHSNKYKFARIRDMNSLFECLKCVIVPVVLFKFYDQLRQQIQKVCCCFKNTNQEMYNSLNLRYSVYQQTVHESNADANNIEDNNIPDDTFENDGDKVAILS